MTKAFRNFAGLSISYLLCTASFAETTIKPNEWQTPIYRCTATALDDSGLFFTSIGHSYGEAYDLALNKCTNNRRRCWIDCSY